MSLPCSYAIKNIIFTTFIKKMSVSLTVMTFNLHDDQPPDSPNSWEKRRDICISVITSYSPIILCTQQGVKTQLDFLQQGLPGNNSIYLK
ncbi:Endonuclease/exonuclease/phosphatase superfamily [Sesbania bispinosa]|nr:Endonuclease/exonuclease/phosphatase superfamily [Sesbania bispinosa]